MGSLQGFRCRQCRTELLARPPDRTGNPGAEGWAPPLLCCGLLLRPFPTDQVVSARLRRPRRACCPVCGYSVQIVVHPDGPLVCAACRRELVLPIEKNPGWARDGSAADLPGDDVAPPAPAAGSAAERVGG
jgi:hypothetical protein